MKYDPTVNLLSIPPAVILIINNNNNDPRSEDNSTGLTDYERLTVFIRFSMTVTLII